LEKDSPYAAAGAVIGGIAYATSTSASGSVLRTR
jgi:hypothetical protein